MATKTIERLVAACDKRGMGSASTFSARGTDAGIGVGDGADAGSNTTIDFEDKAVLACLAGLWRARLGAAVADVADEDGRDGRPKGYQETSPPGGVGGGHTIEPARVCVPRRHNRTVFAV